MKTISFSVPDAAYPRVIDAICALNGYQAQLDGGQNNPESKAAFAKRMIAAVLKQYVRSYEANVAAEAARVAAVAMVDDEVVIT